MTAKGEMWEYVMREATALQKLVRDFGEISLWKYAESKYVSSVLPDGSKSQEFIKYLSIYVETHHGKKMSDSVVRSLTKNYCISTADHHGPLGHPFFFQSAILRGLVRPDEPIVNLCTSHVSLGNSSYPRGLVVHGVTGPYMGLPFFPAWERMQPVFLHTPFQKKNTQTCLSFLSHIQSRFEKSKHEKIRNYLEKVIFSDAVLAQSTYSEQITLINQTLWYDLFGEYLPPLITLDGEQIVAEILQQHLLKEDSVLKNLMTEISWQREIEECFDGIGCCFNTKTKKGTYLFWYKDEKGLRSPLWRDGDILRAEKADVSFILNTMDISLGLRTGKLIPSGLLMYSTLACYYGVTCFGGFSQGTYLPEIFDAYQKLAQKIGQSTHPQSDILCEDIVILQDNQGRIMTALDMLCDRESWDREKLVSNAKSTSISDTISMMIPEIARCL